MVKELRLRDISDVKTANAFAPEFIADYNRRFARDPRSEHDAHRPLQSSDDLARVFSWQETRLISKSLTLNYKRVLYVLDPTDAARAARRKRVGIEERADGSLSFWHGERELQALRIRSGGELRSTRLEQQANLTAFAGRAARQASFFRAGSLLLSGASKSFSGGKPATN